MYVKVFIVECGVLTTLAEKVREKNAVEGKIHDRQGNIRLT